MLPVDHIYETLIELVPHFTELRSSSRAFFLFLFLFLIIFFFASLSIYLYRIYIPLFLFGARAALLPRSVKRSHAVPGAIVGASIFFPRRFLFFSFFPFLFLSFVLLVLSSSIRERENSPS